MRYPAISRIQKIIYLRDHKKYPTITKSQYGPVLSASSSNTYYSLKNQNSFLKLYAR